MRLVVPGRPIWAGRQVDAGHSPPGASGHTRLASTQWTWFRPGPAPVGDASPPARVRATPRRQPPRPHTVRLLDRDGLRRVDGEHEATVGRGAVT